MTGPATEGPADHGRTVYIHGNDFKAIGWTGFFKTPVRHFLTMQDIARMLRRSRRGDLLIYRYQNCPPKLTSALALTFLLVLQLIKARLFGIDVVWICHNVDQDTLPHHKSIERVNRRLLSTCADHVFVLDPAFILHCQRQDATAISFGKKSGGSISAENLATIRALSEEVDTVILIAGQDGGKYKAFERIPEIHARFADLGKSTGFIAAGISADRHFPAEIEARVRRIFEPDMRESDLSDLVHYIYRENADISMPFTVYAAATAGIPILTSKGNILAEVVVREGIGLTLDSMQSHDHAFDFDGFLKCHQWRSLKDALLEKGIDV